MGRLRSPPENFSVARRWVSVLLYRVGLTFALCLLDRLRLQLVAVVVVGCLGCGLTLFVFTSFLTCLQLRSDCFTCLVGGLPVNLFGLVGCVGWFGWLPC